MTDQALKDIASFPPALLNSALLRARQNQQGAAGDKVVPLSLPASEPPKAGASEPATPMRDWSSALELIREASDAIRIGEQRAVELEQQLSQVLAEAGEEIKRLNAQIADGEIKLAESEERAEQARARADEAEAWMARFHDAVVTAFEPVLKGGAQTVPDDETAVPTSD